MLWKEQNNLESPSNIELIINNISDVGACEVISGLKTKNNFEQQLRTEHCK